MSRPILALRDAADLARRGLLKGPAPGSPDGMRRLHRQWTYPGSCHEEEAGAFVGIPDALVSRETLLYVGYSPSEADHMWDRWGSLCSLLERFHQVQTPEEVDDDGFDEQTYVFEDFITDRGGGPNPSDSEDDAEWTASLTFCGMAPNVQAAILDPLFRDIRLAHSAFFWARETVAMRYAGLRDIQKASYERETALAAREAAGPGPSSSSGQGGTGSQQAEATPPGTSMPATWGSAQAMAARHAPQESEVVLYKGLGKACIRELWDDDGNVVRLQELLGRTPSDFHAHQSAYSFTPDDQVAEDYAAYAKRRSRCESAAVVAIAVPSAAIKALEGGPEIQRLFWPSPEWKELVWHSRRKQRAHGHLRKYGRAMLTIGSMARRPNAAYRKLASWEAITDEYVLRVGGPGGPMAVQLVFSGDDCDEWLMEHGARTLKAYPLTSQELKTWAAHRTNLIANGE